MSSNSNIELGPSTQYLADLPKIRSLDASSHLELTSILSQASEPLVLKGLVAHWPLVQAAQAEHLADYLARFDAGVDVVAFELPTEAQGRIFYNQTLTGFNFTRHTATLNQVIARAGSTTDGAAIYLGSTPLDYCLPGLRRECDLPLAEFQPLVSLWLGNQTRIAAHFDQPDNIACVVAGSRRFTLFPPEQLSNLYIGPWDFNPAGQAISLVDFAQPDDERFPRFKLALESAQVAELEAGDALFIPSMWWHHVESLAPLNALVNYWWRQGPAYQGLPVDVLQHALLNLRPLPKAQRAAWANIFNQYIFCDGDDALAHIPEGLRGTMGLLDDTKARQLRALLRNKLNR